ncbi:MAG: STAS domain-containing protein [Ginsengibacter sp.]
MKFKIDTKEKMHVITVEEEKLTANMTADVEDMISSLKNDEVKNVVINLKEVTELDETIAKLLANIQQVYHENNHSLVFCNISKPVESFLDDLELFEVMNVTPTESEAWDIVQMEEIEREYL